MKPPDHFSVSQLRKYLTCPLKYRLEYIDRTEPPFRTSALVLGTAVHAAAHLLHEHLMDGGIRRSDIYHETLADSLASQFKRHDVRLKEKESLAGLRDEGCRLLDMYREHREAASKLIIAAEHRVECDLRNIRTGETLPVPFVGYIDVIEEERDAGPIVVDIKTASKSYTQDAVDGDLQLSAYALVILMEAGAMPSSLRIDALVRNKTPKLQSIETTRSQDDLVRFWSLARAVWAAIQAGHFYPNPSWLCGTCEYAGHCAEWGLHNEEGGR